MGRAYIGALVSADVEGLIRPYHDGLKRADRDFLRGTDGDGLVDAHSMSALQRDRGGLARTHRDGAVGADGDLFVSADFFGTVNTDGDLLIVIDRLGAVMLDVVGFVVIDSLGAVVADCVRFVILNADVLVFFSMEVNLLCALFVFEPQFVGIGAAAAFAGTREDAGLRHIGGQRVGRHLLGVVNTPGDDGVVRVTFEKIHDDFLADTRDGDHAPILTGPRVRNSHPARAVFVFLTLAVPMKLHLHPAVFVCVDFIAAWADDDGRLRTLHKWLRSNALWTEWLAAVHGGETATIGRAAAFHRFIFGIFEIIRGVYSEIFAVLVSPGMAG